MLFTRSSKWIKEFPSEYDRSALLSLLKTSKGPLEKPRALTFVLADFTDADEIESAIHQIEQKGWSCRCQEDSENQGAFKIKAQQNDYVINDEDFIDDVVYFQRIANIYKATYDGWYASH